MSAINADRWKVPVEKLRRACDPATLPFATTAELDGLTGMIGQQRAVRAMEFGLGIRRAGYHVYMSGPAGTGKTTYARSIARQFAAGRPVPPDWVYLHNFRNPDEPLAVALEPGRSRKLRADLDALIDELTQEIPKALESEEFAEQRQALLSRFQEQTEKIFEELDRYARAEGFQLRRTATGFATIPLKADGHPLTAEEFARLDERERDRIEERSRTVQLQVAETLRKVRQFEQEAKERLRSLERELVLSILEPAVKRLKESYADVEALVAYFDDLQQDVLQNLDDFRQRGDDGDEAGPGALLRAARRSPNGDAFARYRVNILVDNSGLEGAPVIFEPHPVYYNLVGKQEYAGQVSAVYTDHTMIKAGALHRANGGFLILQARDVLANPPAWDALKRALLTQEVQIESIGEQYRLVPVRTIRPQPVPLDVKVILVGSPLLFHLLHQVDEDFRKLFKIKADFDTEMPRNDETVLQYGMFISSLCRREGLRHFDRTGVARVIEYSSRLADDQAKVSTRFNEVVEILYEADAWAERDGADLVRAEHVERAIAEKVYRSNRIEEKIREMIERGKILVDTEGAVVGQVNGLSVLQLDDYAFGRPSRITARTFLGEKGIVNIERETELSGQIHDKGVLTLAGYLGGQYAQDKPLSLTASLTFEQLYEGVDGDSASSAELYALLSSLAELPLRQDLAVTGSVDQYGRIQPVGGVNQKIEGFFRVCKAKGLTGTQGVIIPAQNVDNLMLDDEVIEAVRAGMFHIYAIHTVDEGLELLTGVPAGRRDADGRFPEDSVHGRVSARLEALAAAAAEFGEGSRGRG
ncbi:MAG TPA: ATP-binding protein [Bacillota bacterium]